MINKAAIIALIDDRLVEAEKAKEHADGRANLTMWAVASAWGQRFQTLKDQINQMEFISEQVDSIASASARGRISPLVRGYDAFPHRMPQVFRRDRHALSGRNQTHEPVVIPPGAPRIIQEDV